MKHTEQYCKDLLKKVIEDLEEWRGYESFYDRKAQFEAFFYKDDKNLFDKSVIKNAWRAYARVPKDGWKGGNIIIHIDDDTGKALTYVNTALGGRPITLPLIINEEGKYRIDPDYLPTED
jgi:hypothetical protein